MFNLDRHLRQENLANIVGKVIDEEIRFAAREQQHQLRVKILLKSSIVYWYFILFEFQVFDQK